MAIGKVKPIYVETVNRDEVYEAQRVEIERKRKIKEKNDGK